MENCIPIESRTSITVGENFYIVDNIVYTQYNPNFKYLAGVYIIYNNVLYKVLRNSLGVTPSAGANFEVVSAYDNLNRTITVDYYNNAVTSGSGNLSSGSSDDIDYTSLSNKPQINSIELSGNKSLSELGIQEAGDYATQSYVDSKISGVYVYKGTVSSESNLPASDVSVGDVYNVSDTGANFAWTGSEWDNLGATVDLSGYVTNSDLTSTLGSYVTSSSLNSTLGSYVTTSSLSSTLSSYATTSTVTTLSNKVTELETALDEVDSLATTAHELVLTLQQGMVTIKDFIEGIHGSIS